MSSMTPITQLMMAPVLGEMEAKKNEKGKGSWFEALAQAWGAALDHQAGVIEELSANLGDGNDNPSAIAELQAQSLRMSFMSTAEQTSVSASGEALNTIARK